MPSGFLSSVLTPLFLSSVSLPVFVIAVPMRECLGKHLCMSSPFPLAIPYRMVPSFSQNEMIGMVEESPIKKLIIINNIP